MVKSKIRIILVISFLIIQLLTIIGLVRHIQYDYLRDAFAVTVLFIIFTILEIKYNLHVSNYIRGLIIITIISHNFLGEYMDFYTTSSLFDRIQHIFGTYAFTLYIYTLINQIINRSIFSKTREFIFIVSLGIALGVILEVIEFLTDTIFKPLKLNQPSLMDTDLDLICDIVGAIIAAVQSVILNFNFKRNRSRTS